MIYSLTTERKFTNVIKNTPEDIGPGSYEIIPKMGNKKRMKAPFGCRQNRTLYPKQDLESPAPGAYEAKPLSSSVVVTSVFQSETQRKIFDTTKNPSPADYGHIDKWGKQAYRKIHRKKLATMRPHSGFVGQDVTCFTPNQNGEWVPIKKNIKGQEYIGPGTYSPIEFPTKYRKSFDSASKREIFVDHEHVPSPCDYSPMKLNDRYPPAIRELSRSGPVDNGEPVFVNLTTWAKSEAEATSSFRNRETRELFPNNQKTPSPVIYAHRTKQTFTPGHSFGHKMERKYFDINVENPGPGAYEGNNIKWIKGSTGTTPRAVHQVDYAESKRTPGPGSYINLPKWSKKRPSSVFQSRTKRNQDAVSDTPGAADYFPIINDKERAVPPLIRESRYEKIGDWIDKTKIETPSTDRYQNICMDPGKGITIPTTTRQDESPNKNPGPGAYNVVHGSMKGKSFNSAVRNNFKD